VAIPRTFQILYGAQTVPLPHATTTPSGYVLDLVSLQDVERAYRSFTLGFTCVIRGTGTDAQFATALQALRAAFSKPNQDLTINMEGVAQFAGTGAAHTFMGAEASFVSDPGFQGPRSHGLRVTITGALPADLAGKDGRFSATTELTKTEVGKRVLQLTASYSGLGGTSASGHLATFEAYAAAIAGTLGGDFELAVPASFRRGDDDFSATFSTTYTELLSPQSDQGTNDPRLVNTRYRVERSNVEALLAEGLGGAPPSRVRVSFSTGVLVSAGVTEAFVVESVILPFLESRAAAAGVTGNLRVVGEQVTIELMEKRAAGYVDFEGNSSDLIEAAVEVLEVDFTGKNPVAVLDPEDPYKKEVHEGPGFITRKVTILVKELGFSPWHATKAKDDWVASSEAQGFEFLHSEHAEGYKDLALPNGTVTTSLVETGWILFFEWIGEDKSRPTTGGDRKKSRPITQPGLELGN